MRDYYGHHYDGQFTPLDCAMWSTHIISNEDEDIILQSKSVDDKAFQERWSKMGEQARLCYIVFHALADQYSENPTRNPKDIRALQFWARSLEDCERRGL